MRLGRRSELLIGAGAFLALGTAFMWHGARSGGPAAVLYWALGGCTVAATLLFLRVRWTPPLPGPPVRPAPDASDG